MTSATCGRARGRPSPRDSPGEQAPGGYYINAAQGGEAPGRWFGRGAEALGFAAGQVVEREPYEAVYRQVDPRDGTKLGRSPGGYAKFADHLARLRPRSRTRRASGCSSWSALLPRPPASHPPIPT